MKTEKEIYEYLWRELGRFEPEEPEAQTEFDWYLTKISRELEISFPKLTEDEVQKALHRNTVHLDNRDGALMARHPATMPIMQFNRMAEDLNAILKEKLSSE